MLRYRRTVVGPLWLVITPFLFIAALGGLYSSIGSHDASVFIPYLAIGFVTWTLISGFVIGSATIYQRNRAVILQGSQSLGHIATIEVMINTIIFLHQLLVVAVIFLLTRMPLHWIALESLVGIGFVILNGIWVVRLFGILGARYRDLAEIFQAVMRIAFLASPILWMPGGADKRGGMMGLYLVYNPFYHFLEVVRAPLLGDAVAPLSWFVVVGFTLGGFLLAHFVSGRHSRFVALWV